MIRAVGDSWTHASWRARAPLRRQRRRWSISPPAAQARRQGRHPGLFFENISVLVARDRKGATFDAVLPNVDRASIAEALEGVVTPDNGSSATAERPSSPSPAGRTSRSMSRPRLASPAPTRRPPHQQRQRLSRSVQGMDALLPRRRRQKPAQLSGMEASLGSMGDQATPPNWILGAIGIGPYQQLTLSEPCGATSRSADVRRRVVSTRLARTLSARSASAPSLWTRIRSHRPRRTRLRDADGAYPFPNSCGPLLRRDGRGLNMAAPAPHPLESWSDIAATDGVVSIVQTLIRPPHDFHSAHRLLAVHAGEHEHSDYDRAATWRLRWGARGLGRRRRRRDGS